MPNTTELHIPSNKVRDIERYIHTELATLYPEGELRMFSRMLFEAFLNWDTVQLLLHRDDTINQSDLLRFHWAVEDLKQYRPIQHIIGYADFCDLQFQVSPDVLIPRPETAEIVDNIHLDSPANILDLCTGSGCIAITLAKRYPEAQVYGVDISEQALAMARNNATHNDADVRFVQCDILQSEPSLPCSRFDLIVSNPPYIQESERADMQPNVLNHEPSLALFVPDTDPLRFYRIIAQYATKHLSPNGLLIFEINEYLGLQTCQLLHEMGYSCTLHQDFRGKDRSITAQLIS